MFCTTTIATWTTYYCCLYEMHFCLIKTVLPSLIFASQYLQQVPRLQILSLKPWNPLIKSYALNLLQRYNPTNLIKTLNPKTLKPSRKGCRAHLPHGQSSLRAAHRCPGFSNKNVWRRFRGLGFGGPGIWSYKATVIIASSLITSFSELATEGLYGLCAGCECVAGDP